MRRFAHLWFPYWPVERMAVARLQSRGSGDESRDNKNISKREFKGRLDGRLGPRTGERPLVLVTSGGRGIEITALNAAAASQGLWVGQGLADARALLPGLLSLPANERVDGEALSALAQWCGRYGPQRNVHDDCGIWIDVTGVAHLYGGEAGLLSDAMRRLQDFGLTVCAGLAGTPSAAYALARFAGHGRSGEGRFSIIEAGGVRSKLADYPVEALRLTPEAVLLLRRLGLKRIGQLYGIARASLQRRFNDANFGRGKAQRSRGGKASAGRGGGKARKEELAAEVVLRLDQLLGEVNEPLYPLAEPPLLSVRQSWTDPLISTEGIVAEVGVLARQLVEQLGAQGLGCRHVRLSLFRADGTTAIVEAGTSMACRDGDHLLGLLSEKFASIDAGFGIDVAELVAVHAEQMEESQARLSVGFGEGQGGEGEDARALTRLVDRLVNRLGRNNVQVLEERESHIPERAQRVLPACAIAGRRVEMNEGAKSVLAKPPRPPFLLSRPEPISVCELNAGGKPAAFVWRRVLNTVVRCEGPERIAPEWWRDIGKNGGGRACARETRERDYYRVEVEGGARFWIFHELSQDEEAFGVSARGEAEAHGLEAYEDVGGGRWLMHGLYAGGA